jgi:hypothetical protein
LACILALALLALTAAAPVLVDNTNASAVDAMGCGVGGAPPCRSIGFGVNQALKQAPGEATRAVDVQGGGAPYLGECAVYGIRIPSNVTFAVVGLGAAAPVIDCEGGGRAFCYGAPPYCGGATPVSRLAAIGATVAGGGAAGAAAQLTLEGLVVRNGNHTGFARGGGVYAHGGELVLRRCAFEGCSAGTGGAVCVENAALLAEDSSFTDCESREGGGGVAVWFNIGAAVWFSVVTGVTTTLRGCSFVHTTSTGTGGGGAVMVAFDLPATNITTTVTNSSFTGCSATGDGGAIAVSHDKTAIGSTVAVTGSKFSDNAARSGDGGALALSAPAGSTGVSLLVELSDFRGNKANGSGSSGGAVSVAFPGEAPQNLNFVADPNGTWVDPLTQKPISLPPDLNNPCSGCTCFPSCSGCPPFASNLAPPPVVPRQYEFRRWDHAVSNNTFLLRDSHFDDNLATLSGGALAATGGGAGRIERCDVEGNNAQTLFAGGFWLGGTVTLNVSGSRFARNTCVQGGGQIYSSSGAGVAFMGGSSVELGCARSGGNSSSRSNTCVAGLSAVQSGEWTWDASSGMSCAPGYELVNSSKPAYNASLDDWQLKAPVTIPRTCVVIPGTEWPTCDIADNASNCPCYFTAQTDGFGSPHIITPEMLVSALSYACSRCTTGQYSLATPTLGGAAPVTVMCTSCPYGGSCSGGDDVTAAPGFWGSSSNTSSSSSSSSSSAPTQLSFFRCPGGYCCDGGASTPCVSIGGCAGNRNGALCGGCAPGFAQTVGSTACRAAAECGGADALWFAPLALLLAALFALYSLGVQGGGGGGGGWPLNAVQPMFYFYQMAQLLPVGTTAAGATLAALAGFFNMQLHVSGGDGFACPFPALTTLQAIELHYAGPAVVAALLGLGYSVEVRKQQQQQQQQQQQASSGSGGVSSSARRRYGGALVKVATLAYSTVLSTTFQLLHCVDLGSGGRALFRAATQACGAWQAPFYALAAALLLPVALVLGAAAGVPLPLLLQSAARLPAQLRSPYREDCEHWEAVLALHRLGVVAVYRYVPGAAHCSPIKCMH